jgi:hypothetical protein
MRGLPVKRFLSSLVILFVSVAAFTQVDIPINTIGANRTIARNWTWAGSGVGALNNNFIFTPSFTNEGICLSVTNNDTSTHAFTVLFYGTGDQTVKTFVANAGKWALLGPTSATDITPSQAAGTTVAYYVLAQGAANVAIVFSGASGTGTGTLNMVESQNGANQGCGNIPVGPVYCPLFSLAGLTGSTTTADLITPTVGMAPYICNFTLSFQAAPAAGFINILEGTGALCVTNQFTVFTVEVGPTTPLVTTYSGIPLIPRYSSAGFDMVGKGICIQNTQATAGEAALTIAQF